MDDVFRCRNQCRRRCSTSRQSHCGEQYRCRSDEENAATEHFFNTVDRLFVVVKLAVLHLV